ncbi:MAG TPA: M48 family metalloprotease, partial [Cyanophyceae cyanobacterium]
TTTPQTPQTTPSPTSNRETVDTPNASDSADKPASKTTIPENGETTTTPDSENSPDETEAPKTEGTTTTPNSEETDETKQPELTPEELARQQKLIEADQLYKSGQISAAQQLYREAKDPFSIETQVKEQPPAIYDPKELSPAGSVYWRMAQAGLEQKLETKIMVPLQLLVEQYPEFIPGQLTYAQALNNYGRKEEALQVLERATTLYPKEPELLKATITSLGESEKWLEASLIARQFALLYPDHAQAQEFTTLADENLERYKKHLRSELRGNAIANVITGALGYVLTGNLFGPISAVDTTVLMLRGESAVGESFANRVKKQLPMLEDEDVLNYVREVGNKLASVAGRNEFHYEFYVILDDKLNAFALPGGKVFVNAGAILKTHSEAELAGLLAHELSHAVLSHGFQLITQGNLIANVTQFFPFGGTAANLIVLDYSRDMERQADALGTRILASSGYAADGLHNLMITLDKEERDRPIFAWLSTHPDTKERISNIESLIERNGYNRYGYEGVQRHLEIQKRVEALLQQHKEHDEQEEHK